MVYPVSPLHPADYDNVLKNQPKDANEHTATVPQVNTIVPETKKSVVQSSVTENESFEMNDRSAGLVRKDSKTDYGAKPTDAKHWPGHSTADSILESMQRTFGNNAALPEGKTYDTSLEKDVKKVVADNAETKQWLGKGAADSVLESMQRKFGHNESLPEGKTYDMSLEKQVKKVVADTAKDTVDAFKQVKKDGESILEAMQEKFGHNDTMNEPPATSSSLTIDQQIRKTAKDTWDDVKESAHQVCGGSAEEKAKAIARAENEADKQRALKLDL